VSPPKSADSVIACQYLIAPFRNEVHHAIAMTAAQCVAVSTLIPGTVTNSMVPSDRAPALLISKRGFDAIQRTVRIEHPGGLLDISVVFKTAKTCPASEELITNCDEQLMQTGYKRTVRVLAEGVAMLPGNPRSNL
jgi:2-methylaconitate cis-trans-isomerase PrpF